MTAVFPNGSVRRRDAIPAPVGERRFLLTLIREVEAVRYPSNQWKRRVLVRCTCGDERVIDLQQFTDGRAKSCRFCWSHPQGPSLPPPPPQPRVGRKDPAVGEKRGLLTFVERVPAVNLRPGGVEGHPRGRFLCDCGNYREVNIWNWRSGDATKCIGHGLPQRPARTHRSKLATAPKVATHAVYRVFDADGRCLYVGCSATPWTRMQRHARRAEITQDSIARVDVTWHPSLNDALAVERAEIQRLAPPLNVRSLRLYPRAAHGSFKEAVVRSLVAIGRPTTSIEVCAHMGFSTPTQVSTVLNRLRHAGVLEVVGEDPTQPGRPAFVVRLIEEVAA